MNCFKYLLQKSFVGRESANLLFNKLLSHTVTNTELNPVHPEQRILLEEPCILVDELDHNIGTMSKQECHLLNENGTSPLHRAFSVFLFNSKGEILLQQRSDYKVTFPGYFTNTCCSHPLFKDDELVEENAEGVLKAAQRRLNTELGIPKNLIPIEEFHYLTRIHYFGKSDSVWAEHEIDYVLFFKKDVTITPNVNEVKDIKYVSKQDFSEFLQGLQRKDIKITPWFKLIVENFLFQWWENLDNLDSLKDHHIIHSLK